MAEARVVEWIQKLIQHEDVSLANSVLELDLQLEEFRNIALALVE
jgi:glutaminase